MRAKKAILIIVSIWMLLSVTGATLFGATITVPGDYATIQGAIDAASDGDVINIASGTYTEAGIEVDKSVTIQGQGESNTIVQAHAEPGQASDEVFHVTGTGVTMKDITIQYGGEGVGNGGGTLTLTNCAVSQNSRGGGVSNTGTMTLTNCTVRNNSSYNVENGGGITNWAGTMTLTNCTITNNEGDYGSPGGICNVSGGRTTLANCTITNNEGNYGSPGGICNGYYGDSEESTMTLTNCTISNNEGGGLEGSGIQNLGAMSLTNCTVSSNHSGAGISNGVPSWLVEDGGVSATLTLTNCTVTNNEVGGIDNWEGTVNIKNTIVADNIDPHNQRQYDVMGVITSLDYNLIEDIGDATIQGITTHNIYGIDPMLLPLAENGGFTQTCALQEGSPAINAGTDEGAPATDQRGYARVGAPDIGAYESGGIVSAVERATWGQIKAQF